MAAKLTTSGQRFPNLEIIVAHEFLLPTPTASQDMKPVRQLAPSEEAGDHGTMLCGAIGEEFGIGTGTGFLLNPRFVEMIMGFPPGWITRLSYEP